MRILTAITASVLGLALATPVLAQKPSTCTDCVKQKLDLAGFSKIQLQLPGHVEVRKGSAFSVEVEARPEDQKHLKTTVTAGKLVLEAQRGNHNFKNIRWYVTLPSLEEADVEGTGTIDVLDAFTQKAVTLDVSGTGTIRGSFTATSLKADVAGTGTIDVKGNAETLTCDISGTGTIKGNVQAKSIKADISGTGQLNLNGTSDDFRCDLSGAGSVKGLGLETRRASIEIGGTGSVETSVSEELSAEISGSGTVSYKGNPAKVHSDVSGVGRVKHI